MNIEFSDHDQPITTTRQGYEQLGHQPQPILAAIRAKCIDCSGGSPNEVKLCRSIKCPLFPLRMNSNPWRKEQSAEQRAGSPERMKNNPVRRRPRVAAGTPVAGKVPTV
jgi:hypothetical protein